MHVTVEQARALDALAIHGTLAKAAAALGKRHSAVVYSLKKLEAESGLALVDRSGYRVRLTAAGERLLVPCRNLLRALGELEIACHTIKTGWEPTLRIVFDGIFPAAQVLDHVKRLAAQGASTRVEVLAEFLAGVESGFFASEADLMISVLPPHDGTLVGTKLPPVVAWLVAHRDHPLAHAKRVDESMLAAHSLLTVRGSDPRLRLSTEGLEGAASVKLNDFHSKREAILAGLGYGWLPEYLASRDLRSGAIRKVPFVGGFRHEFHPDANRRPGRAKGRAAELVLRGLARR